jgi:hypothetical protein
VVTIRCTRKLRKYLKVEVGPGETDFPTTRLRDWYGSLLFTKRQRLIVCISERSLLAVFVAAKDPSQFVSRVRTSVRSTLWTLGVSSDSLDHEMREMNRVGIGSTASRSVVGWLNELILEARFALEEQPEIDLLTLAIEIADTPWSPLKYESPRSAMLTLLR